MKNLLRLPILCLALAGCLAVAQRSSVSHNTQYVYQPVPATAFGLNTGDIVNRSPTIPFGTCMTNGRTNWPALETANGTYAWAALDGFTAFCSQHNAEPVVVLAGTPSWASNSTKASCIDGPGQCDPPTDLGASGSPVFSAFCGAAAQRVGAAVKNWIVWNEPNSTASWTGTPAQLAAMTIGCSAAIKAVNPNAIIVSPPVNDLTAGGPAWLAGFYAAGGGSAVDVTGYHNYSALDTATVQQASSTLPVYSGLTVATRPGRASSKPVWMTEGDPAGYGPYAMPLAQQPAYIAQFYALQWSLGVQRIVWYAYDGSAYGGMVDGNYTETTAAKAYAQTYAWMVGATLARPCHVPDGTGTYNCQWNRAGGYSALELWNSTATPIFTIPAGYVYLRRLDGTEVAVTPGATITLGNEPVLLETIPLPGGSAFTTTPPVTTTGGSSLDLSQVALGQNSDFKGAQIFPGTFRDVTNAEIDTVRDAAFQQVYGANNLKWQFDDGSDMPYYVIASKHQTDLQCFPVRSGFAVESQDYKVCLRPGMKEEGGWDPFVCHKPTDPGNDRHLTIIDIDTKYALETYQGSVCDGIFVDDSATLWDLTKPVWGQHPLGMTSSDVAGLPLVGYLANYYEAAVQGVINHPIRMTMPKSACGFYDNGPHGMIVKPAMHPDNGGCGSGAGPTYGDILRLRADFDISGFSPLAQVFLKAFKKYGLSFNDNGGSGYFQGTWDTRWDTTALGTLSQVRFTDLHIIKPEYKFTAELSPEDDVQGVSIVHDQTAMNVPASAGGTEGPLVVNNPPPPTITSFQVDNPVINLGQSVTFTATYTNGTMAYVDNAGIIIGGVTQDKPDFSTDYKLRVQGMNGYITSDPIHVTVNGPQATVPGASPAGGFYNINQNLSLTCFQAGCSVHYKTDGTAPNCNSTTYTGPVPVTTSETVKYLACAPNYIPSPVGSQSYSIGGAAAPTGSPAPGGYPGSVNVALGATTPGSVAHYSITGAATCDSPAYGNPISVTQPTIISAMACAPGYNPSPAVNLLYTINGATPLIVQTATGGNLHDGATFSTKVNFAGGAGALLYYTVYSGTLAAGAAANCGTATGTLIGSQTSSAGPYIFTTAVFYVPLVPGGQQTCTVSAGGYATMAASEIAGASGYEGATGGTGMSGAQLNAGSLVTTGTNRLAVSACLAPAAQPSAATGYAQLMNESTSFTATSLPVATAGTTALVMNSNAASPSSACLSFALTP